jgi:hypothetical protein
MGSFIKVGGRLVQHLWRVFFYQTKVRQSKGRKSFRGGPFKNSRLKLKILKHILVDDQNKSFAKVITDVWPDGPFLS